MQGVRFGRMTLVGREAGFAELHAAHAAILFGR
jgi:hypothetical protein